MAQNFSQQELVKKLVDSGVHFGHPVSRWNPKMEPYIYGRKGNVHLIDIKETVKGLLRAKQLIQRISASGKDILFVGTKRQARDPVKTQAERCGMHHVTERWLGGTLTNFRTIRARLERLGELDAMWESGEIDTYSKKMKATLSRERKKIKTNLDGIRRMEKMPGLIFIVDVRREKIAVNEAKKLGIPTIALIDTDGDPDMIDLPIPGNDDAMRAIDAVMVELADSAEEGRKGRAPEVEKKGPGDRGPKRRSERASFRAEQSEAKPTESTNEAGEKSVKLGSGNEAPTSDTPTAAASEVAKAADAATATA